MSSESSDPSSTRTPRWKETFAALRFRNYRLWFIGQLISLFGTWMQTTAQGFLIYEITRSPGYLGIVGFAAGAPTWFFTLYGGVVADRFSRRSLMIVTQSVMMILALILAALAFLHVVQPWHIIVLAMLLGTANSFDAPARQAFVSEMVESEYLTNAIALNSTMFNSATALGPAIAGLVYALFGPAWCFTINALSFVAVIVALRMMELPERKSNPRTRSTFADLKEGIHYVITEPITRTIFVMIATTSMFALSMVAIIPAWSVNILHGDAALNGFLLSSRGLGSLLGALLIASMGRVLKRGKLLTFGSLVYPIILIGFALVHSVPLSIFFLAAMGVGTILVLNLANALVQTSAPDHLRGRVMGAYTWIFFGFMPIGALWTGALAESFGEPAAVIINACLAFLVFCGVFVLVPALRKE